jgi:hypothetical protein
MTTASAKLLEKVRAAGYALEEAGRIDGMAHFGNASGCCVARAAFEVALTALAAHPAPAADAEVEAVWLDNFSNDFPTVRKRLRNISALLRRFSKERFK